MVREITKKAGRFGVGGVHDWPLSTWQQVAKDAGFKSIEDFSKPAAQAAVLAGPRGRGGANKPGQSRTAARA